MYPLFDKGESVCSAASVYDTAITSNNGELDFNKQFYCINSLRPGSHRKDSNVAVYRNILVELDQGTVQEQMDYLRNVPCSLLTYSGGKSVHLIISLEEPCTNRAEYDALVRRIYAKLPMADKSTKNPSRLSRTPLALRDNGVVQDMLKRGGRTSRQDLQAWLGPEPAKSEQPAMRRSLHISPWTLHFLLFGASEGGRNQALFKAACDLLRHGWSEEQILAAAERVLDLSHLEMVHCIKSARNAVKGGDT